MKRMQKAIEAGMGKDCPDICLVDWHFSAIPARASSLNLEGLSKQPKLPSSARSWLQDVVAIRPQGEEIGELVGYKLARALRNGTLRRDRPMHLIGHSAGGFVVMHAALVLLDLGVAPKDLRVTMLDTPLPVVEDLRQLLRGVPLDYYCSSAFAKGVPAAGFAVNFTRCDIAVPRGIDQYTEAHSYAYDWYIDTIKNDRSEGFGVSPFAKRNKQIR